MLMKAAFPPYRKDRLRTCRTNVRYCRGRTGMVVHTEKRRHCREVRRRDRMDDHKSASFSVSPSKHKYKRKDFIEFSSCISEDLNAFELILLPTWLQCFPLVSVH